MLETLPDDLTGIVLEITENEPASEEAGFQAMLEGLRRRGARLAVDDAGAGYAGLRQLMVLRPDVIKLDRGLIDGVSDDPAKLALVEAFVRFARRVHAEVCAEGIESLEDLRTLADADVSYGQGYVLARPAPPWAEPLPDAKQFLRQISSEALRDPLVGGSAHLDDDRALEEATTRVSRAGSHSELKPALEVMARCLHAHQVSFSAVRHDTARIQPLCRFGSLEALTCYPSAERPLAAEALRTQQVRHVVCDDPDANGQEVTVLRRQGERSLLLFPVVAGGVSVGLLEIYSPEPRSWSRLEVSRARLFASQLAGLLRSEASRTFHTGVLDALGRDGDSPTQRFLQAACEAYGWDLGLAWTFASPDDDTLTLSQCWSSPAFAPNGFLEAARALSIVPGLGIPGRAWASRQPVWVQDVLADRGFLATEAAEDAGLSSTLALPVRLDGRLVSVVQLFSVEPRPVQADSAVALMQDAERIARIVAPNEPGPGHYDDLSFTRVGAATLEHPA